MKDNRILIDTSVWIDYLKEKDDHFAEKVNKVLTFSDVYVPMVVIAELIQGSKSEKEIAVIEEFIGAFNIIDQTDNTWLKAGRLSFYMKRKGVSISIIDCYIAVIADENNCKIFSLDEHFRTIKKFMRLELII